MNGKEFAYWRQQADSFQQNLQNRPVGLRETFFQSFLIDYVEQILVPFFVAVFGILGGKIPVADNVLLSHEQESYAITSFDGNCMEFEFQTDLSLCVDWRDFIGSETEID